MRFVLQCALTLLLGLSAPAFAAQEPAFIVFDLQSGNVLAQREAGRLWHPASLTKLMTAYVTFKALRSGEVNDKTTVVVSKNALREPPAKMGYKVGTEIDLDQALKMMLVRSANDIAVAVAETVGKGSEAAFIRRMNSEARRLGLASTFYHNPHGLPDQKQVTTARDLAVLSRQLWRDFPEYRPLFGIPAIKAGNKVLKSQNTLLERFRGANGMKTGFICDSGFNMVATATRSGRNLAVVVLGSENARDRAELAARLLDDGFRGRLGGSKGSLTALYATKARGPAVNMRDQICKKRERGEGEEDPVLASAAGRSALEPRFILMDPVPVYPRTGTSRTRPASNIPIPRPRPILPHDAASSLESDFDYGRFWPREAGDAGDGDPNGDF